MATINDVYRIGVELLEQNNIDDASFDARCLLEHVLQISTTQFMLSKQNVLSEEKKSEFLSHIEKRIAGTPLQYIIGSWEFYGNTFKVGEGVLIPRPETELLVELAVDYLKSFDKPIIVDFCSGSGCIAISVAKCIPNAKVYAVEKYDEALQYLNENISLNSVDNVTVIKGDIFDKNVIAGIKPDLILSNPPYIRSDDIPVLSKEVLFEPKTALDGGADGYDFYKILCNFWFAEYLKESSAMMVECAEDQGDYISGLFSSNTIDTEIINDFNGLQRIVTAFKY